MMGSANPRGWLTVAAFLLVAAGPAQAKDEDDEPDFPARLSQPLVCPQQDEAPRGVPLIVRCVTRDDLAADRIVIWYRGPGNEEFASVRMKRSPKGWQVGTIPAEALQGRTLQYYVEAVGAGSRSVASHGRSESPTLVVLVAGAPRVPNAKRPAIDPSDENPLLAQASGQETNQAGARGAPGRVWIGLGIGAGYGWHSEQVLQAERNLRAGAAMTAVGPAHIAPEVGFRVTSSFSLALQGRLQIIPQDGDVSAPGGATQALSILLRGILDLGQVGDLRFYGAAMAGGGAGFRLVIPARPDQGLAHDDTVRGGPFVAGVGAGAVYQIGRHFGLNAEINALMGAPDTALTSDFNGGVQLRF